MRVKKIVLSKKIVFIVAMMLITVNSALFDEMTYAANEIKIGDYIIMGEYDTNGDGIAEDILWRCIDIDEQGPLMLSDTVLCNKVYDAKGSNTKGSHGRGGVSKNIPGFFRQRYGSNYWGDSNIRDWLNSKADAGEVAWSCGNPPDEEHVSNAALAYASEQGFLNSFSEFEQSAIKLVKQKSLLDSYEYGTTLNENYHQYKSSIKEVLSNYDTAYSEYVTDRIFLLDIKQLYNAQKNLGAYIAKDSFDTELTYWLRSPYANGELGSDIRCVFSETDINYGDLQGPYYGVRPAFYINIDLVNLETGAGTLENPYILGRKEENTDPNPGTDEDNSETTTERSLEESSEATTETSSEESSETTTESVDTFIYGDADNNKIITNTDVNYVIQKALNLDFRLPIEEFVDDYKKFVDVDNDGSITASDAAMICEKAMNKDFVFPVEK